LIFARPPVLSAARVKENRFWLSFIAAPSCRTGPQAATGKFCRYSGSFASSPRAWAGGSGQPARAWAGSSAVPWQTGPEEAGAGESSRPYSPRLAHCPVTAPSRFFSCPHFRLVYPKSVSIGVHPWLSPRFASSRLRCCSSSPLGRSLPKFFHFFSPFRSASGNFPASIPPRCGGG
jgi:hypothetical protein